MRHPWLYIRPFEPDDLASVARLLDTELAHDDVSPGWLRRQTLLDPDYDAELALVAIASGDLAGFAQGILRPGEAGPRAWLKWFATSSGYRRRGVMTRMVDTIETIAGTRGAQAIEVASSAPLYPFPGVDPRYCDATAFLHSRGYRKTGTTANMACDLRSCDWSVASDVAYLASRGITIRRACRNDQQAVFALLRDQFPGWLREVAACFLNKPISLHMALDGHREVGFAAYDAGHVGAAWFGPMGTHPDWRGRGIGRALLRLCMADLRSQGHVEAVIPWVGPVGFYAEHCGAAVARFFTQMSKDL